MARYVPKDSAYRRAHGAGFRSRAALKLQALDQRFRLLRTGARVVDLGCWPGGWLQVAAATVGPSGTVVGIDSRAVEPLGLDNVETLVGDVTDPRSLDAVRGLIGGEADIVLSDLAPKLTGVRDVDAARQLALYDATVKCCEHLLARRGFAVVKLFSDTEAAAMASLGLRFGSCAAYRPGSTRKGSSEIYAVCRDFSPP